MGLRPPTSLNAKAEIFPLDANFLKYISVKEITASVITSQESKTFDV